MDGVIKLFCGTVSIFQEANGAGKETESNRDLLHQKLSCEVRFAIVSVD
jgi:hypothetical protein